MIGSSKQGNRKIASNLPGFTLVELLVSVSLFAFIILSVTGLFKLSIDSQRQSLANQNIQDSLKYFFEMTSKEMRMAKTNEGDCSGIPNQEIFFLTNVGNNQELRFKNYYDQCVSYYLVNEGEITRFYIRRETPLEGGGMLMVEGSLSPQKIDIKELKFLIKKGDNIQPIVTMMIRAVASDSNKEVEELTLQTSVASRYYKNISN